MRNSVRCFPLLLIVVSMGCHHHHDHHDHHDHHGEHGGHHGHDDGEPAHHPGEDHAHGAGVAHTSYSGSTQLFIEVPDLVRGEPSALAPHLTTVDDFRALRAATVTLELSGGNPTERFKASPSNVIGIYSAEVAPKHAGTRSLRVVVEHNGAQDSHDLGTVTIAKDNEAQKLREDALQEAEESPHDTITFTKEQQWQIGFTMTQADLRSFRPSFEAYGTLVARPDGHAHITASHAGLVRLPPGESVTKIGDNVTADDALAVLLPQLQDTADLAALEEAVIQSRISRARAQKEVSRLQPLVAQGIVAEKRLVDATYALDQARAAAMTAKRRLTQAERLSRNEGVSARDAVTLKTPLSGTVVMSEMIPGSFVTPGTKLFEVIDLDRLWLQVHVTETHASFLEAPKGVWFSVTGLEDSLFEASADDIVAVGSVVDSRTRTLPLYVAIDNSARRLRVGMFADVHVLTREPYQSLGVPSEAVLQEGGQSVVYLSKGGESFERRPVRTGTVDGDYTEILEGLDAKDWVVSTGAFAVRLASTGNQVPSHGHHH